MGNLQTLLALFDEGVAVPIAGDMVVWVNKLSPFQSEQINHQARIARARRMLAIKEVGTPESDLARAALVTKSNGEIVDLLARLKGDEHLLEASQSLHSADEWRERLEVLEHSAGQEQSPEEVTTLAQVSVAYQEALLDLQQELQKDYKASIRDASREDLLELHANSYAEQQGLDRFIVVRRQLEIYYAMRECRGADPKGKHLKCDHTLLFLEKSEDVALLPESVSTDVGAAYDKLNVPTELARFTAGPASSSESSGPSSSAEASAPSGPEETSAGPDQT